MPINTISDMVRTLNNVTTASVASTIVARRTNLLNDEIFAQDNKTEKKVKLSKSKQSEGEAVKVVTDIENAEVASK
jgi:Na+/H+-dicarboxylate symporter